MNEQQKDTLLQIAHNTVAAVIMGKPLPELRSDDPELTAHCGCFVTIKNHGKLRGCIGQFTSDEPLIDLVVDMARASASGDPRFMHDPVTPGELDELDVEISVLSPLKRTTDPLSLRMGIDGIYIKRGRASGCFLPQVADETNWSKEQFLGYCCSHKAGLPPDAWKDPDTDVYLFTAEVFGAEFRDI